MENKGCIAVKVEEGMSWEVQKRAVEMAAFLGFQTTAYEFPAASRTEGIAVPESLEEMAVYEKKCKEGEAPQNYTAASDHANPIDSFDWRRKKGLESMMEIGTFLKDENRDLLPDAFAFKLVLPKPCSISCLIAACNLAFRFGMETTAYQAGIVAEDSYQGVALWIEESEGCELVWKEEKEGQNLYLRGKGKELEDFSTYICNCFPKLSEGHTWISLLQNMTDSFCMNHPDGQLAYAALECSEQELYKAYVSPELDIERAAKQFPNVEFRNYKGMIPVYERTYDVKWEVDHFKSILKETLYERLKPGDVVRIHAALSEQAELRRELEKEIDEQLKYYGASGAQIHVLCAYKQGYSWLEETFLPEAVRVSRKTGKKVSKAVVSFRPLLPEGIQDWGDVDGATPSYNNTSAAGKEHWFDLPIRFLQELYPVEDLIKESFKLKNGQVDFQTLDADSTETYAVTVYDDAGEAILSDTYCVAVSERPYLDAFEEMGKVHPSTGYVRIWINEEKAADIQIPTDAERIWKIYQEDVLKECAEFVMERCKGKPEPDMQPFFSQLRLDITASEPDYRLPSREDLCSSLDALHEDLYFAGSDYFKNMGLFTCGRIFDAPGLILPVIRKENGAPSFKVTLYEQEKKAPCIVKGGDVIFSNQMRSDIGVWLKGLSYQKGSVTAKIETEGVAGKLAESYAELLEKGLLEESGLIKGIYAVEIKAEGTANRAVLPEYKEREKKKSIQDIDFMESKVIGYDDYRRMIEQLKEVPGLSVYRTAVSYMGREIYAVEILPKEAGYISRTKRISMFPSEVINARHHANEVSGTNAAFMLIKEILTNAAVGSIADKLNLVIVPMENVDGAAIHYELQKDNPNWKLHVARFNAIGKEFYYEHFKPDTIHTEAMGFTNLWRSFLPDVVVDNHGVPSHEWEQPFSGYTAPAFKGFWLPRSLLYGYFWHVTDEEYKSNYTVNKRMENVIADAILADPQMADLNKAWMHQFELFAHQWMPKLFPANYYKDMINYWVPFAHDSGHRYPSIRFPWITTVAYTSEVADETAQGEYLNLCARAHVTHDLAIMKMLAESRCIYEEETSYSKEEIRTKRIRKRPVVVPADFK